MKPNLSDLPVVYLKPGELYFANNPTVVTTVLGSCVSVTMFNPANGVAAICHALLPEGPSEDVFRYVDSSILHMLEMFEAHGIRRSQLEVKMFGGSDMLGVKKGEGLGIGKRNVEIARQVLSVEGLALLAADVGGARGRKLFFYTHTGEIFMKRLRKSEGQAGNNGY